MDMAWSLTSTSVEQTRAWGRKVGGCLRPGDVVALLGDLGAGKTAFAQGVGEALGVEGPMTSPTFTLIQEYSGQVEGAEVRVVHMDLYRLRQPEEAEVIGVEDMLGEEAVCLIEWPEIAADILPPDRLQAEFRGSGEEPREIVLRGDEQTWGRRLQNISDCL